ncbi:MAG: DUF1836 domain-containing protein [Solobacterium sp.]|nr:DUF1836 domain-containing protein [Solobacterium sp.]
MSERMINEALAAFRLPQYREIPDVGLFLDQTVKYLNGFLKDYPGMEMTGSMISNYVKQKIIPKAYKKTYSRDQISQLFFIAMAKSVLSMDQIRKALSIQEAACTSEERYEMFRTMMSEVLSSFEKGGTENAAGEGRETKMIRYIVIAIAHKMYLDQYFEYGEAE